MTTLSVIEDLQSDIEVFFPVNNECFRQYFIDRGGIPFDDNAYRTSYLKGTVVKMPSQYPKNGSKAAKKLRHWTFDIPALFPETEWEFDEFGLLADVKILMNGLSSNAVVFSKEDIDELFTKTQEQFSPMEHLSLASDILIPTAIDTPIPETLPPISIPTTLTEDSILAYTFEKSPAQSTRSRMPKASPNVHDISINLDDDIQPEIESGYDTETQNAGEPLKRTQEEESLLHEGIDGKTKEIFHLAIWNPKTKKWFAQENKRSFPPTNAQSKKMSNQELAQWSEIYEINRDEVRPKTQTVPKSFPKKNFNGQFTYCGCYLKKCKVNVAGSTHFCLYCKCRLSAFCLVSEGCWGLCRKCYFNNETDKLQQRSLPVTSLPKDSVTDQIQPNTLPVTTLLKDNVTSKKRVPISTAANPKLSRPQLLLQSFTSPTNTLINLADVESPDLVSSNADDNLFAVVLDKGILIPPKPKEPYVVDELDLISRQSSILVTEQLWTLLCCLVQSNFDVLLDTMNAEKPVEERNKRDKGSPTMTNVARYQTYCQLVEDILGNYADSETGAYVLGFFHIDEETGKPAWHPSVTRRYYSLKEKCRRDLQAWLKKGGKEILKGSECKGMNDTLKTLVYVGSMIATRISSSGTMANTHINKHWPYEFKSGQSPSGLLLVIRKWYWQDIVAPKKISDSFKNWQSAANKKLESNLNSKKTQGESENDSDFDDGDENDNHPSELTQAVLDAKKKLFESKNLWNSSRFPDAWLAWYVYGPPKCGGHTLFMKTEMQLLTKVKAPKPLTEEEEVIELGAANKYVRKIANKTRKGKSQQDTDNDSIMTAVGNSNAVREIKLIREDRKPLPTAFDHLERAITSTEKIIALLERMLQTEIDEDGEIKAELKARRKELRALLSDQIGEHLDSREDLKRQRTDDA